MSLRRGLRPGLHGHAVRLPRRGDRAARTAPATGSRPGIFTADLERALRAAQRARVRRRHVNEAPTFRADQMPYGGVKDSGNTQRGPGLRGARDDRGAPRRGRASVDAARPPTVGSAQAAQDPSLPPQRAAPPRLPATCATGTEGATPRARRPISTTSAASCSRCSARTRSARDCCSSSAPRLRQSRTGCESSTFCSMPAGRRLHAAPAAHRSSGAPLLRSVRAAGRPGGHMRELAVPLIARAFLGRPTQKVLRTSWGPQEPGGAGRRSQCE